MTKSWSRGACRAAARKPRPAGASGRRSKPQGG